MSHYIADGCVLSATVRLDGAVSRVNRFPFPLLQMPSVSRLSTSPLIRCDCLTYHRDGVRWRIFQSVGLPWMKLYVLLRRRKAKRGSSTSGKPKLKALHQESGLKTLLSRVVFSWVLSLCKHGARFKSQIGGLDCVLDDCWQKYQPFVVMEYYCN